MPAPTKSIKKKKVYFSLKSWFIILIILYLSDHQSFIGMLQELQEATVFHFIPDWAYVPASARFRLPTYTTSQRWDFYLLFLHPKSH